MADKIDQLVVKNSQGTDVAYDIDLPVDASPSIASLTASGSITSEDGTSSNKGSAKLKNEVVSGSTYLGELQLVTGASALSGVHGLTMTSDSIIRDIGTSTTFTLNFPTLSNGASKTLATTDYVSGVNDGTNWTSLTINGVTKNVAVGSSATDVQINGTSITSSGVANIITNSAYNASSNKIATMSDIPGTSNFVTLNTAQTITGAKTFSYTSGSYTSTTVVNYNGIDVTSQTNSGVAVRGPNAFIVNYNGNNYAGLFHDDGNDVEMRKYTGGSSYTYTLPNATGVLALNGQAQPASDVYAWAKASTKPSYTASEVGAIPKLTYEWNKEISFGSSGALLIGKFPMYDSNITIDIDSTTSTTYHGTLVIATQNINTTRGGTFVANVYGDANNTVTGAFKIQYSSGSNKFNVYFQPQAWSKNLVHIRAVALAAAPTESEICTNVTSIPSTDLITVTNQLTSNFLGISAQATDSAKLNGQAASYYLNYNNFTNTPTDLGDFTNNAGYVKSSGVTSVATSGTGISGGTITSTGTITLDSSSAGNAATNKVVLRNASGSIQSEKIAISSGTTTKATMQYNTTDDCIEFIFA